jgi:FkbM family methyltransferase
MKRREFIAGAVVGAVGGSLAVVGRNAARPKTELETFARQSYSEQGEDIVLFHAARDILKVTHPTYVDVGAAEPIRGSNTYLLYWTGARGVLVEPNPTLVEKLKKYRPGDTVVAAGIGVDETTEADYYVIRGNAMLNTFSKDQVGDLEKAGNAVDRVVKMPLITLNRVIEEHLGKAPDILSTDIEGWDLPILRTLDFDRFRPGAICSETASMTPQGESSEITKLLVSKGYIVRGGSMVNTIFVDAKRL